MRKRIAFNSTEAFVLYILYSYIYIYIRLQPLSVPSHSVCVFELMAVCEWTRPIADWIRGAYHCRGAWQKQIIGVCWCLVAMFASFFFLLFFLFLYCNGQWKWMFDLYSTQVSIIQNVCHVELKWHFTKRDTDKPLTLANVKLSDTASLRSTSYSWSFQKCK